MLAACAMSANAWAAAEYLERSVTTADLFGAGQAAKLARTLPVDRAVNFRVRLPDRGPSAAPSGVVVFIKPTDTGTFPENWSAEFDARNLVWISPDDFGNDKLTRERMLAAIMAAQLVGRIAKVDTERIYVAGMSGGGRVASQTITHSPQLFAGAIYIVGADPPEIPLKPPAPERRFVFITGRGDFNRGEMRRVFKRYGKAGATHVKLMDLPHLAHEYPSAEDLGVALDFLDAD
jgi:pimeloyl-ACP methyl ester carboxylesterase